MWNEGIAWSSSSSSFVLEMKDRITAVEWVLICAVMVVLGYPAWVRGGTYVPLQWPLPWLGLGLLLILALCLLFNRHRRCGEERLGIVRLLKDPVLYMGAGFLLLIVAQKYNSGRVLLFDAAANTWKYSDPQYPHLPSVFVASEAAEMFRWFFPALVLVLVVRSGILGREGFCLLLVLMTFNAALLCLFGLGQYISGTDTIYGLQQVNSYFFASFGYANHAGAFFVLLMHVAAGLLLRELSKDSEEKRAWRIALYLISGFLCGVGATMSLSRAAIAFSWVLAAVIIVCALHVVWRRFSPAQRVNLVAGTLAIVCLAFFVVAGAARSALKKELSGLKASSLMERRLGDRLMLAGAAVRIWKDYPVFGAGAWSFPYLVGMYVPESQWKDIARAGRANVHNDPAQFLAEFGIVGGGLLAGVVIALVLPLFGSGFWRHPLLLFLGAGAAVTLMHSLIDLPFRCPAILYHWVAIVGGLSVPGRGVDAKK